MDMCRCVDVKPIHLCICAHKLILAKNNPFCGHGETESIINKENAAEWI